MNNFSPDIHLEECADTGKTEWNEFLSGNSGSFYQLYGWSNIIKKEFNHDTYYLAARDRDGKIVGVFPLIHIESKLFGNILCSMPFLNYGGLCVSNEKIQPILLDGAVNLAKSLSVDFLELRSPVQLDTDKPVSTHKVSMTIALDDNPETIWNNFASKHRTNIRRVYKNGIHVKSGGVKYLEHFYHLISRSWRSLGTPIYKKSFFKRILDEFDNNTKIYIAYYKNQPVAGAFNGMFNQIVEGLWAGSLFEYKKLQANYVLYWEMIKDSCEQNYQYYHLGRSTIDSGGEQFKKKWKATQQQLYWYYHLNKINEMPQINIDNPKYKLAIKVWQNLPISITNRIGPLLARSIP